MRLTVDDNSPDVILANSPTGDGTKYPIETLFPNPNSAYPYYGFLPPVVKYISPTMNGDYSIVIVEGKPMPIDYRWYPCIKGYISSNDYPPLLHHINIPWHQWILIFQKLNEKLVLINAGLVFSKTQMQSLDHAFYPPFLLNAWDMVCIPIANRDFVIPGVCFDRSKINAVSDTHSLAELYEDLTRMYWGGFFNLDLYTTLRCYDKDIDGAEDIESFYSRLSTLSMHEVHKYLDKANPSLQFRYIVEFCNSNIKTFDIRRVFTG